MKKASKVLSVIMVLAMLSSLFVFSANAAVPAKLTLTATQTASSPDIYKVTVSAQCANTLQNMNMVLAFDKTAFKLIRNTGVANTTATNSNGYLKEGDMTDENCYDGSVSHPVFGTSIDQFSPDFGYANGVGTGSFTFQVKPNAAAYGDLSQDDWQAILFDWTANFDDNALLFDCSTEKPVFSFYLQKLETAQPGKYEIGYITGGIKPTINYDPGDAIDSYSESSGDPLKADLTVENAIIDLSEDVAGPAVTKTQAEVKMTLNEDKTAVDYAAAPFQFRVISSISEDDWNTYFNGDGSNIESVGFVAYKGDGAFDMETAKSVAMGDSAADYQAAKTDYIQKVDGQPANFGARIDFTARENVKDVTYIAFVQYDTDQYAFYAASFDADLNSNYDDIVSQYAEFIAG